MRAQITKILSILTAVVGGALMALRYATDFIGRSTVVEDAQSLAAKAGDALLWLADQPAIIFTGSPPA